MSASRGGDLEHAQIAPGDIVVLSVSNAVAMRADSAAQILTASGDLNGRCARLAEALEGRARPSDGNIGVALIEVEET